MPALHPLHWQVIEKVLLHLGYRLHRQKGSHRIYVNVHKPLHVTVPENVSVPVGTICSIIRQIGISRDEFLAQLESVKH